jgi:hypothetical protein
MLSSMSFIHRRTRRLVVLIACATADLLPSFLNKLTFIILSQLLYAWINKFVRKNTTLKMYIIKYIL